MCIVLSRVLLSLACSLGCISLFFGLVFIWRPWRPLIGRAKSLKLTWTRLRFRILNSAQYRECLATILNGINIHIQLPMRIEPYLTDGYWTTDMLTTWRMSRTGTKRGYVPDPRPNQSRFPVQMELVRELSKILFDRSHGGVRYLPMSAHIRGYPKFESWSAKYKHYWQASTTGCLLIKTSGSSARPELVRAKVWDSCEKDDGKDSLTVRKGVSKIGNTPSLVWTDDGYRIGCTPCSMGYGCDAAYWMWLIAEIHFTMASVNWPSKSQYGTQAQTLSVGLPWEGILLLPITFHVRGEECIYKNSMMNYSTTTSSLRMYLSIALQAAKGSSTICSSGEGQDNAHRGVRRHGDSVGSNRVTSLAEGETSCAILLDYKYPASKPY